MTGLGRLLKTKGTSFEDLIDTLPEISGIPVWHSDETPVEARARADAESQALQELGWRLAVPAGPSGPFARLRGNHPDYLRRVVQEGVRHANGIRYDNRPENLEVWALVEGEEPLPWEKKRRSRSRRA